MRDVKRYRVIQYGLGAMGRIMARMYLEKKDLKLVGAFDADRTLQGKDLGQLIGTRKVGVRVGSDAEDVLSSTDADVVVYATRTYISELFPQIKPAIEHRRNVISIAEELSYPTQATAQLAGRIDRLAKHFGVTVLGTGINPGFVFDTNIITLSAICHRVDRIVGRRALDLDKYGASVFKRFGLNLTRREFEKGREDGSIASHVGFENSIMEVADSLGWKIDKIWEHVEPIVSKERRVGRHGIVEPGKTAGQVHSTIGEAGGRDLIELTLRAEYVPRVNSPNEVVIEGIPSFTATLWDKKFFGHISTAAAAVNMIPRVVDAEPGLTSMKDFLRIGCLKTAVARPWVY